MKKVCLVKGGNFVLGIESSYILSRQNGMLAPETAAQEGNIFHLGALLARKHCKRPEPGSVFLQVEKEKNNFFLLVDQVIDEIELPGQTTRLPPPSPELAHILFPQVAVCMNLIVLLLDPGQIIPVARQLGQGIGVLAREHCVQVRAPQRHKYVPAVDTTAQQSIKSSSKNVLKQPAETQPADKKVVRPAGRWKTIKKNKKRPKSVNEETFKRIMAWTISQFKQGKVSAGELLADQLPPGLVQQEGLSDTVIQYLIDQISLRCQESITPSHPEEHHEG
ncbi:hypothetical protein [Candidatus Electrothrix sp.]|uniref:hypothetical protein n=1 Tax=Candidatus Electrothrix sp. TaxID=2170559 RepID=UPI0040564A10